MLEKNSSKMSWLKAEIISLCVASCSLLGFVSQMPQFPDLGGAQSESVVFGGDGILLKSVFLMMWSHLP